MYTQDLYTNNRHKSPWSEGLLICLQEATLSLNLVSDSCPFGHPIRSMRDWVITASFPCIILADSLFLIDGRNPDRVGSPLSRDRYLKHGTGDRLITKKVSLHYSRFIQPQWPISDYEVHSMIFCGSNHTLSSH